MHPFMVEEVVRQYNAELVHEGLARQRMAALLKEARGPRPRRPRLLHLVLRALGGRA